MAEPQGDLRKMQRGRGEAESCWWTRQRAPFMRCTRASLSQTVLQGPTAVCGGAAQGTFAFLLLLLYLEGAHAAVQRGQQ